MSKSTVHLDGEDEDYNTEGARTQGHRMETATVSTVNQSRHWRTPARRKRRQTRGSPLSKITRCMQKEGQPHKEEEDNSDGVASGTRTFISSKMERKGSRMDPAVYIGNGTTSDESPDHPQPI
jgi:hypothetical protein